jgi:hypothetical protein
MGSQRPSPLGAAVARIDRIAYELAGKPLPRARVRDAGPGGEHKLARIHLAHRQGACDLAVVEAVQLA